MKKGVPALVLALALALTVPAWAAQDTPDNFVRSKTYAGQFSDLTPESTFYDNVAALYAYGLSVGKADGSFGLRDQLTVGHVVIFAGRIRSLYRTGDAEAGPGAYAAENEAAALRYLRYLQAEGVIGTELDESLSTPATRAQVAHVLANTLPEEALPPVHTDLVTQAYASRQFITDVTEYTPYYQDILTLYRTGVSVGSDAAGSFLPDQPITRGAAAAMLTRMVDPSLRATPDWDLGKESWSAQGAAMGDLVPLGTYIAAPATAAEIDESVRYMLASNQNTLVLQYPSLSVTSARRVMEAALAAVKTYCEQCYNTVNCTYSADGSITLTFSAASAGDQILTYRDAAMEAAIAVHDALWESGEITTSMSDYEKARVYFTWICDNCVYDYTAGDSSLSHIAYSLFENGTAVCDGYTGAYNLLLKLEGIDCTALSNNSHIWTVATLDGTDYHIDTTWGDSGPAPNYDYFAMTAEESWQHHSW